ncbi:MAG: HEAT repeat domain-containing protein [Lewinella sp.]|nr:HEAT repeat domain-containing protein [Lewinella sp.]
MKLIKHFLLTLPLFLAACQSENTIEIEQVHVTEDDFAEAGQVSPTLAEGFELDLWAPGPLVKNAVALTFDNQGIAYIAETARRKTSDIDIRAHRDWMTEDLALQSLDDTRALHIRKLAPELSDENTWMEDFNQDSIRDYHDLEVQSEYIRRVWDSDGDGRADVSQLYAEGFNDMLTGVAAGILNYDDEVYLTAAPDVWRLKDSNGDGVADERTKIAHGFGIHIAYAGHDMSGLTMGPDGRVYWSIGDMGVNAVDQDGKNWKFPNQGAVMRCNPDGSGFEVFAHGLRNPQELAFDNFGNLFSVDNDGDHPGEHERYVHIVEGSDSGWRINWQYGKYDQPHESYKVWMDEGLHIPHFPGQAAYITPPLALAYDGPAGLAFNPGTALGKSWNNYFFASFFTGSSARSKIQAFRMEPKGASFAVEDITDIVGGIVPTGITFAADGALYINDWKDSYDLKPAGRIWKLDLTEPNRNKERAETQTILQAGMKGRSIEDLRTYIAHDDQRVRMAAQFELAKRAEAKVLTDLTINASNLLGRIHAIWGMGQLGRQDNSQLNNIADLLADDNEQIRAQTAKVMGDARFNPAFDQLISLLNDRSPIVQFFAAQALGKLGNKLAFDPLVALLEKTTDEDTHMRHAVVYALSQLDQAQKLAVLKTHPNVTVRLGAVVALRTMKSPLVADFLQDSDPLVLAEAARAINDDFSIPEALPALAATLEQADTDNEVFIRRTINANLRVGNAASAMRLAKYAQKPDAPTSMRTDALWALGYWPDSPVLDRVDGRYRGPSEGLDLNDAHLALDAIFTSLISDKDPEIQEAIVTAAGRLRYDEAESAVYDLFVKSRNKSVRIAALQSLAQMNSPNLTVALDKALLDKDADLRASAQELLNTVALSDSELVAKFEKILNNNTIPEKQLALASLAKIDAPAAKALLQKWMEKFTSKIIDPSLQLDLLMAVDNSNFDDLKAQKEAYESSIDSTDILAKYEVSLYGGDAQRGQRIFYRNESAQCVRCHKIGERNGEFGGEVGPELTHIASRLKREDLLLAMVAPSDRIAPGYGTVILKLKDGQEVVGTLQDETNNELTIKTGNADPRTFKKSEIDERETMPSGMFNMSDFLTKTQIRDVVAFLTTLK